MRLDYAMEPLRRETVQPEAFLRQAAADFLNSGLAEGFPLEVDFPTETLPPLEADRFLLRRAVNNLLVNCVRHNAPGCSIRLGAQSRDGVVVLWVESSGAAVLPAGESSFHQLEADGGAGHGTGLRLVSQIASAHGGHATFYGGDSFRCELWLPVR